MFQRLGGGFETGRHLAFRLARSVQASECRQLDDQLEGVPQMSWGQAYPEEGRVVSGRGEA